MLFDYSGKPEFPPYPLPRPGIDRLEDPETIEAALTYWSAVERDALNRGDWRLGRIAAGLRRSFELATDRQKRRRR